MFQAKAKINLTDLRKNYRFIKKTVNQSKIMAVVKADAYGHGVIPIATTLCEEGVYGFSVALISEAQELIKAGIKNPVLHLGKMDTSNLSSYSSGQIRCTINSIEDAKKIIEFSKQTNSIINAHLKIDTGMGRMGSVYDSAGGLMHYLSHQTEINIEGLYSHFSSADNDSNYTNIQLNRFIKLKHLANQVLPKIKYFHIANSSAIIKENNTHLNMVRPGVSLYGISPLGKPNINLIPIMEFTAPVVFIKNVTKGQNIGYHKTYQMHKKGNIALVQAGYADGVPTILSNSGSVDFKKEKYPIIGKISMDLTCLLNKNNKLKSGDTVTFWGKNYRLENIAKINKTIPYEILTNISRRVIRVYKED